jgi:4-hydroxybenzoate polyprenyltransferase
MTKVFAKLYRMLVFTNVLIALAAVGQCLLTYLVLDKPINIFVVLIEGMATLLLYNASLWLSKPKNPKSSPYERTRWVFSRPCLFWTNSVLAIGVLLYSFWHVHFYTIIFLGFIGVVSLVYSLPLFRFHGKRGGLRQVPGLKLFHIAVVWSLSGVGLPVVELWAQGYAVDWLVANYLGILKILFLLICTLPFDIRDMEQDSYYHLKTIPNMIGEQRAKRLCYIFLWIHIILVLVAPYSWGIKAGLVLTNLLIVLLLRLFLFRRNNEYHNVYLLDIALIVQYILVLIVAQVF